MTKLELIMLLLPIVFMVHEYEEIIMFRHWLRHNRQELKSRFPRFEKYLVRRGCFDFSTATFSVGTAHEFLLISVISFCSVSQGNYQWWFAAFSGYSIHILIHLSQWLIYRKYVPFVITSILTLPYCIYTLILFATSSSLSPSQMFKWTVIGMALTALSLFSTFYWMSKFQQWQDKY